MRKLKLHALLVVVILALGCLVPKMAAQDEDKTEQENSSDKQKESKKSEERKGPHQKTKDDSLSKPLGAYHLEFTIRELDDGKVINSRAYELVAQQGLLNKLRIGGRVPVATGQTQFQYVNVGVNIDCFVQEREGSVLLSSTISVSGMAQQREEKSHEPVLLDMTSEVRTVLSPGKPTFISKMDDPTTKARFEIEATATKVK